MDPLIAPMIGREVIDGSVRAVVKSWEPYGPSLCDVLIATVDGWSRWTASHTLRPVDPSRPLPSRREVCAANDARTREVLIKIRQGLVQEVCSRKPWPGAEYGKVIVGRALDEILTERE